MEQAWHDFFARKKPTRHRPQGPGPKRHGLVSNLFPTKVKELESGTEYVMGRDPQCEVVLPGDTVSRQHALLKGMADGGFVLKDMGSRNKTYVNHQAIDSHLLEDGDEIKVSVFVMVYRVVQGSGLEPFLQEDGDDEDPEAASHITGEFTGSQLLEIAQLIELNQRTGQLHVSSGNLMGRIDFDEGFVVWAGVGRMTGEAAAARLLRLPRGTFRFAVRKVRAVPGLRVKPTEVLLNVSRSQDQLRRRLGQKEVPFGGTLELDADEFLGIKPGAKANESAPAPESAEDGPSE